MTDSTNSNNSEEETNRVAEAMRFVSNYCKTKNNNVSLEVSHIDITITNLIVMVDFLTRAVVKLVENSMADGSTVTSVNRNLDQLDTILKKGIYS